MLNMRAQNLDGFSEISCFDGVQQLCMILGCIGKYRLNSLGTVFVLLADRMVQGREVWVSVPSKNDFMKCNVVINETD